MAGRVYEIMDWGAVESIVYSEEKDPHSILGPHLTEDGLLIQAFLPRARKVSVVLADTSYGMEEMDEAGFFAALLPLYEVPGYRFEVVYEEGRTVVMEDPYRFEQILSDRDLVRFNSGICYDVYEKLGAHCMSVDGTRGVLFAVWAPNALRVSVVGDFNAWDGRVHPMRALGDSGVFELFVPGLSEGLLYKFEIKAKGGLTFLKADPYANAAQLRPETASVIAGEPDFAWTDEEWMKERAEKSTALADQPVSIYEVHLASFRHPKDGSLFQNYREIAPQLASYVKNMGYTHVELMPIMEHPLDESLGYQTSGYYAPTARYGSAADLMSFMNYMHREGIGVILEWAPCYFPADDFCLRGFDGTCLYEHRDPRQGVHPQLGTLLYNYARPEVSNFLIGSALFWLRKFHADGLKVTSLSSMLYLDYGKRDGEWVANMYGGNENLDAAEFVRHLNSIVHKENSGILMIADETTGWPEVTAPLDEGGLGFDLKWDSAWTDDFMSYMELDPIFRGPHHTNLTYSLVYHYGERYLLPMSHWEVTDRKGSMTSRVPGKRSGKLANLRAAFGYQFVYPGKKLTFMGMDLAADKPWDVSKEVPWELLEKEENAAFNLYMKELLKFYRTHPALYELDEDPAGFEWINSISANENMLVFLRKGKREEDTLLIVLNFSALTYEEHKIGVPFSGKYKEVFNSDAQRFGGKGHVNPRVKNAKADECDMREYSIRVTVAPLSLQIFTCTRVDKVVSANEKARQVTEKKEKAAAAKGAGKTAKTAKAGTGPKRGKKSSSAPSVREILERKVLEEEPKLFTTGDGSSV